MLRHAPLELESTSSSLVAKKDKPKIVDETSKSFVEVSVNIYQIWKGDTNISTTLVNDGNILEAEVELKLQGNTEDFTFDEVEVAAAHKAMPYWTEVLLGLPFELHTLIWESLNDESRFAPFVNYSARYANYMRALDVYGGMRESCS